MPFQVSPGVNVSEIDLTRVVPAISTTEGALVGVFSSGPVEQRVLISSEADLVARFGKPTADNYETFFTAANFLSYGNQLYVTRVVPADVKNAVSGGAGNAAFISTASEALAEDFGAANTLFFIAQSPGVLGNSLKVSFAANTTAFSDTVTVANDASDDYNTAVITIGDTSVRLDSTDKVDVGDVLRLSTSSGYQDVSVTAVSDVTVDPANTALANVDFTDVTFSPSYRLSSDIALGTEITRYWKYHNNVDAAPDTDRIHIVVIDEDGDITGTADTVLEVWPNVSVNSGDVGPQGGSIYYKDVLEQRSNYIWASGDSIASNTTVNRYISMAGGADGSSGTESTITLGRLARGIDLYQNAQEVDISLFLCGKANTIIANYIIDNVADIRKDCVVFVSPENSDVVNQSYGSELDQVIAFENNLRQSSYAVMDSGYKYQYDKYNDKFRWVPLNGDIAGLCARTDQSRDPWFSPAGYNRGIIKNIIKLAYNPKKAERDVLYKAGVNPVITQPGQGTLLFGDKTLLPSPSAFDRINVRRLFIVLEKAIATAAKYSLFEFNDEFTRAQFRNLVEPFLRDVQGRRGIYDFRVVCDDTNNTAEVIARNEFRGDIYIKPAKSINFIQLNFVAVRSGIEFDEVVGRF